MGYAYENHIPSRAEMVVGMAADAIRRWRDRWEFDKVRSGQSRRSRPGGAGSQSRHGRPSCKLPRTAAGRLSSEPPPCAPRHRSRAAAAAEPAAAQDLARCCTLCGSKSRCARDLASKPGAADWKDYCPNEPTLAAADGPLQPALPPVGRT